MSIGDFGKSVGGAFSLGLNAGTGVLRYSGGAGAMLGFGATGATIGAGVSATLSDGTVDPLTGAAVGGAIGAAALPAAGLASGVIGSAAVGVAKAAPAIGKGALKLGAKASPYAVGTGIAAADRIGSAIWSVGSKMIDWDEDAQFFDKVKFSGPIKGMKKGWNSGKAFTSVKEATGFAGKGKAIAQNLGTGIARSGKAAKGFANNIISGSTMITGIGIYEGINKAWGTLQSAKMGQMTGTTSLTPQVPSYADNAGATGDLVFALNANRRG